MFIRRKVVRGITYYALVKSERIGGKVQQRVLLPMGRTSSFDELVEREQVRLRRLFYASRRRVLRHSFKRTRKDIHQRIRHIRLCQIMYETRRCDTTVALQEAGA